MCLPIVLVPAVVVVVILLLVVAAAAPVAVSVILQGHTTMPQSLTPQLKSFWSLRPKAKSSAQASLPASWSCAVCGFTANMRY